MDDQSNPHARRGRWLRPVVTGLAVAGCLTAARAAWPLHERPLDGLVIRVHKSSHEMWLQDGERIVRRFHVALGREPGGAKLIRGDGHTPQGRYYVCEKHPTSRFRRFLGISYPNIDDAERAFSDKLIDADEWADIFFANLRQTSPPWDTLLGGHVGIHGYGGRPDTGADWTDGCIAVSDSDIEYLYDAVPLGTPVIISE